MKKEKSIVLSSNMVQSILKGLKTQHRTVLQPQTEGIRRSPFVSSMLENLHGKEIKNPYFRIEYLWVKEPFLQSLHGGFDDIGEYQHYGFEENIYYAADGHKAGYYKCALMNQTRQFIMRPAIHMTRKQSRITCKILNTRLHKLQDISAKEAYAEGLITSHDKIPVGSLWRDTVGAASIEAFQQYWNRKHKKDGLNWESNPWVWCIEFEKVEAN